MSEAFVDARGMRCPWPALRLSRAMREGGPGATVRIVADDPAAPREIAALAAEQGWEVTVITAETGQTFSVTWPFINSAFTQSV